MTTPVSFAAKADSKAKALAVGQFGENTSVTSAGNGTHHDDDEDNLAIASNSLIGRASDLIFSVFIQITVNQKPNFLLENLNFIIEDLQLVSFAFNYKLFAKLTFMPRAFNTLMNILQYRGEVYSFRKYLLVFGLCVTAVTSLSTLFIYILVSVWVRFSR